MRISCVYVLDGENVKDKKRWINSLTEISKILDKVDQEKYATLLQFIMESEDDLECSKILYNEGRYRNALILLSQAVEKIAKGNLIFIGVIDEKRARNISHITPKMYIDLINFEPVKIGMEALGLEDLLDQDHEKFAELLRKDQFEVVLMNDTEISAWLDLCDKILDLQRQVFIFPLKSRNREILQKWSLAITQLYYLAFLIYPHYKYARYQSEHKTSINYGADIPIVKYYLDLYRRTEECVNSISLFGEIAYQRREDFKNILSAYIKKFPNF